MSLSFGRTQLSIPGPSVIPETVLAAMHRPSPNIYEGELLDLVETLYPDLKQVARTQEHAAIYIANGHGAWEATLSNTLSRGDKILVLCTGRFGTGWGEVAQGMGIDVEFMEFGMAAPADPSRVADRLKQDSSHSIKAVLTVQTDTSSSVRNDIKAIRAAIDQAKHPALYLVDCICSLGCEPHEKDAWGVDVTVTGCQKGLMTPAGLSFVFFNEKADHARRTANLVTPYWDWIPRSRPDVFYQKFCGTAPTHHLYGIREALNILLKTEGIEAAWARHETLAKSVWAAVDKWSTSGVMALNIADPNDRSHAVTTIHLPDGNADRLRRWTQGIGGLTLGIGLGFSEEEAKSIFRIGHMGHLNVPMIMGALGTIDAGLKALDIPHGDGALDAAASVIANH